MLESIVKPFGPNQLRQAVGLGPGAGRRGLRGASKRRDDEELAVVAVPSRGPSPRSVAEPFQALGPARLHPRDRPGRLGRRLDDDGLGA